MAEKKIQYVLFVMRTEYKKRDGNAESVAKIKSETGFPQGFSVQNTKNATERAYLLKRYLDAGQQRRCFPCNHSETTLKI